MARIEGTPYRLSVNAAGGCSIGSKEAPANGEATIGALRIAGVSVVKYSGGNLADIGALAKAIADIPALPEAIATEIRSAETLFRSSVIARVTGDDYRNAMGLSVFAPGSATVYATNRPDYMRLQFPSLTGWSAVLDVLYNATPVTMSALSRQALGWWMGRLTPSSLFRCVDCRPTRPCASVWSGWFSAPFWASWLRSMR